MALKIKARSVTGLAVLAVAVSVALSGCGAAPWSTAATDTAATPTSTPTSVPTTPAPVVTIVNELAGGTTDHTVKAGNITLAINYYSELNMAEWTYGANKPVSMSFTASFKGPKKQKVYLSEVSMSTEVSGPDGSLPAPAAVSDKSTLKPGYLVKKPYTYSQTFILPAVDPTATSVKLTLTYELLLQTTPTSNTYAKQTATDTLLVAIAKK